MAFHYATPTIEPIDRYAELPDNARTLLDKMPHFRHTFATRQRLIREGERQSSCHVILSGFAHRHRVTADGQRQITGFYVPGDIAGLEGASVGAARQSIETAGPVTTAAISLSQLVDVARRDATVAMALWRETLSESAATTEWVVNIGRRNAHERILNLFCELSLRFDRAGVHPRGAFDLPLTQADIADATGLTSVHVNRVIRSLELEGVIERRGRAIALKDWSHITATADFEPDHWRRASA